MKRKITFPGWLGAVLGGAAYLLLHLAIETAFPDHWSGSPDRLLGISYAGWSRLLWVPSALLLSGLVGIYRHVAHALGRLGKWGFRLAAAGFILEIAGSVIEFWLFGLLLVPFSGDFVTGSAGSNFGYTIASLGTLTGILGLVLFGIACLRAALPTPWRVLPLLIGLAGLSILPLFFMDLIAFHIVLYGLGWMAAGYFLR